MAFFMLVETNYKKRGKRGGGGRGGKGREKRKKRRGKEEGGGITIVERINQWKIGKMYSLYSDTT